MDELILRFLRGEATPADEATLRSWRSATRDNERRYQEVVAIAQLARIDPASSPYSAPPASELIGQAERRTAAALQSRTRGRRVGGWRGGAAAAAAIGIAALGAALYLGRGPMAGGLPHEVAAGPSETTTVALEDGSVVRLAPGSRLRLDPRRPREVELEGRGFFAVARSPDRPFRVRTRAGDAVVLGTRFELATEEDELRLLVVEGHVALDAGNARVDVRGGEASRVVRGTVSAPEPVEDAAAQIGWLGQFLVFQATPLPRVALELERVYGVRVIISDTALAKQAITGWYSDRPFEEVFDIICRVLDARCTAVEGEATVGAREDRQ